MSDDNELDELDRLAELEREGWLAVAKAHNARLELEKQRKDAAHRPLYDDLADRMQRLSEEQQRFAEASNLGNVLEKDGSRDLADQMQKTRDHVKRVLGPLGGL